MEKNTEEKINGIKEKIWKPADLVITRIPKNTLSRFYEIANEDDFCKDYGMALKYLIDFHDGIILSGIEHLEDKVDGLTAKMVEFQAKFDEKSNEKSTRRMMDGRKVGGKEK